MKKIRSKGYTLEVVSWENDADNYQTHLVTVDSEDKALALKEMCDELFNSYHSCDKGISNDCKEELEDKDEKIILEFMEQHPCLHKKGEDLIDTFRGYADDLIGYSEWYTFRVSESCSVEYSPEDVFVESVG